MALTNGFSFLLFLLALFCLVPLLGRYMSRVFKGKKTWVHPLLRWLEVLCYRLGNIHPHEKMTWVEYAKALLIFNGIGFIALFLLLAFQSFSPFNPQQFASIPWLQAFNIAASFVTNTNWQSYAGEVTLSNGVQMMGLTVQNFLSAASGMGVFLALCRGISQRSCSTIGNFWVDLVRTVVYILLPLCIGTALFLVSQGVIQTLSPYKEIATLENGRQTLPLGPVASQVAIKQIGSNGGGFFNANSAHPFENPTPLSNVVEMLAILALPAALTYTYGCLVNSKRHGWLLFFAMLVFWLGGLGVASYSQHLWNPILHTSSAMEGLETRFGTFQSLLWTQSTTTTSNGSVNGMISSLSPLASGMAVFNIMLGEPIFGGVGVGICSMIIFILLTVFLAGLMVGRTPEYLGKKIEKNEMQWVMAAILIPAASILIGAGISSVLPQALVSLSNTGPHGLTELLYAFSSSAGNNGSAFAGLNANTAYYNGILGMVMLLGRLSILLPSLAIAGLLSKKKTAPPSIGTFSTTSPLFFLLLCGVILIVGALTFFPALSLGPIIEHLLMLKGIAF